MGTLNRASNCHEQSSMSFNKWPTGIEQSFVLVLVVIWRICQISIPNSVHCISASVCLARRPASAKRSFRPQAPKEVELQRLFICTLIPSNQSHAILSLREAGFRSLFRPQISEVLLLYLTDLTDMDTTIGGYLPPPTIQIIQCWAQAPSKNPKSIATLLRCWS